MTAAAPHLERSGSEAGAVALGHAPKQGNEVARVAVHVEHAAGIAARGELLAQCVPLVVISPESYRGGHEFGVIACIQLRQAEMMVEARGDA